MNLNVNPDALQAQYITGRLKYEREPRKQTQEQKTPKQKKQNMEL